MLLFYMKQLTLHAQLLSVLELAKYPAVSYPEHIKSELSKINKTQSNKQTLFLHGL